jgi:formamidopyrimidine-DNA glycosylase
MPELPEVETVRRGLAPAMTGRRIVEVVQRRPDLRFPLPERFAERLTGRRITHLGRRAKYLMAEIEGGEVLAMHLGMTGRFTIATAKPKGRAGGSQSDRGLAGDAVQLGEFTYDAGADPAHDHVVFRLEGGVTVTYNDARRFGYMSLIEKDQLGTHPHFASLGVEPLGNELSPAYLAERADGRKADLKAFLMDQRIVAGLGNIYVCEALFRSGLDPKRPARFLARKGGQPTDRAERLVPVIRTVLEAAIEAGGSTLRDYRHADGSLGYFQHTFAVYGREGEACAQADCKGTVRRIVQAGRSTFYCPNCQR